MCATASSATSGTHRSEACSAMQCSLAPRIACMRAAPLMAAHPDPGVRLLHAATAGSRKYRQRVRWRMFPPIVAMLRSCVEALASSASRTNGRRSAALPSAASSSIVATAPTRSTSPSRVIPRSGRRVMSTNRSGASTPSLSIRSTWVVPPARYCALGSPLTNATADATSPARMYSNACITARDLPDGGDDVRIGTAAADVAAHELTDLLVGARPSLRKQPDRRHDLARRAKAALKPIVANERRLHGVQDAVARQALDRRHLAAVALRRQRQARQHALAVGQDRARPARPLVAPLLGAGQLEMIPQRIQQRHAAVKPQPPRTTVNAQREIDLRRSAARRLRHGTHLPGLGAKGPRHQR